MAGVPLQAPWSQNVSTIFAGGLAPIEVIAETDLPCDMACDGMVPDVRYIELEWCDGRASWQAGVMAKMDGDKYGLM